jgi:hypothetical protein
MGSLRAHSFERPNPPQRVAAALNAVHNPRRMAVNRSGAGLLFALIATPTAAFVLHHFVFQLPDNEGDLTIGFFATIVGLLAIWASSGYVAARWPTRTLPAVGAGVLAPVVSTAMLCSTFVVLNGLFIDRMSYEPDRLLAFHRSGYATLQQWWNHQQGWGPFPILICAAAVVGALGGLTQALRRSATSGA